MVIRPLFSRGGTGKIGILQRTEERKLQTDEQVEEKWHYESNVQDFEFSTRCCNLVNKKDC